MDARNRPAQTNGLGLCDGAIDREIAGDVPKQVQTGIHFLVFTGQKIEPSGL